MIYKQYNFIQEVHVLIGFGFIECFTTTRGTGIIFASSRILRKPKYSQLPAIGNQPWER